MDAREAANLTEKGKQDTAIGFFNNALCEIKTAASRGWNQATPECWEEHSGYVMSRLRTLGYTVEFSKGGRHSSSIIIVRW